MGIIVTALILMEEEQRTLSTLCYVISVTGVYALVMLHGFVGIDCLVRITCYIVLNTTRVSIFIIILSYMYFTLHFIAGDA